MADSHPKCSICVSASPKYRCPQCPEVKYCSTVCYKTHEALHLTVTKEKSNELEISVPSDEKSHTKNVDSSNFELFSDTDGLLTQKQMHALVTDEKISQQLKSRELQALIRSIDKSRSRLDALETAEYNIPEFTAFAEHVAQVLFQSR